MATQNFTGKVYAVISTSSNQILGIMDSLVSPLSALDLHTITFNSNGFDFPSDGTYMLSVFIEDNEGVRLIGSDYAIPATPFDATASVELTPGKYVIYNKRYSDNLSWFMSSDLGTASTKRFQADTIANKYRFFYINTDDKFVWDIIKNSDGTYYIKNGSQYVSWTSGNSASLSTTPKKLNIIWNESTRAYDVNFAASSTETRYLALNGTRGNNYFAFYSGPSQSHNINFVEYYEMDSTYLCAKVPSNWNVVSAWVWYDGEEGHWAPTTRNGDWITVAELGEFNVVLVNGTSRNGDNNQTIDISVSENICIQINEETSGKRTYFVRECSDPEPPVRADCKSLPYNENFASNQGDFTIENVALDGLSRVWQFASGYGMKASAYVNSVYHPTESWLISPCMEFPEDATINLTFDHVYRYTTTPTADLTLLVSEDYVSGAPSTATWTPIAIPTYSSGSNWTFVNAGNINLNAYASKNVTLAFRYKSSSSAAATWEIKNVSVTSSSFSTGIGNAINLNNATKCIIDGHLFILRGDQLYDATGRRVE